MDARRSPPSKLARVTGARSRDSSQDRSSDGEESRSHGSRSRGRTTGTEAAGLGEDEIVDVDDCALHRRSGSMDSTMSAVNRVQIRDREEGCSVPRGRSPGDRGLARDLSTCPENVQVTCVRDPSKYRQIDVLANLIRVEPMKDRHIYQYRVDFEPNIESRQQRRFFFREGTRDVFNKRPGFDGMHDIYCAQLLAEKETVMNVEHPVNKGERVKLRIVRVREVDWGSIDMMRVYNLHMKKFLQYLGFYQITATGSWVHSDLSTPIADGRKLVMVRGFKTASHVYDRGDILVQLEAVHKLMQRCSVLQVMADIRAQRPANLREALNSELVGKLVITSYNKRVYRVESVRFDVKPTHKFADKRDKKDISYVEYFKERHAMDVGDLNQPMLQVVPNNKRGKNERGEEGQQNEILLVPELCNITGLTEQQRNDSRLKMDLIKSSQIPPHIRAQQMETFIKKFNENVDIREALKEWGYEYERSPVKIRAHVLPVTKIGFRHEDTRTFQQVNPTTADFNVNELARVPKLENLYIVCTRADMGNKSEILANLRRGFDKVRLTPTNVKQIDISQGDAPADYIRCLRGLPSESTVAVVIMHNQNKEKYDSIKKIASVERGLVTQCVTARLMMDQKKVVSASTKIAIQVAAKIGGEPWWADIPLRKAMVCGYDTARDTAKRGVNYGAFLASLNDQYSRWYSRADANDQVEQVASQITESFAGAIKKYKELNERYPERVFIYRDGVSEGQLALVYETELVKIRETLKRIEASIKLTMIVVNKRVGARFFMRNNQSLANPPPGSVVDNIATRQGRYDFYLVSQSTRNGTVAPTYYNIIHDESNMLPEHHQMMAYKLCMMYFNWSGSVRVPAPCQYAQKLASLCGEHLHAQPNALLNDRLHFL